MYHAHEIIISLFSCVHPGGEGKRSDTTYGVSPRRENDGDHNIWPAAAAARRGPERRSGTTFFRI
ncbi:hypothetical protein MC57_001455 [Enterobacter hormaechei]|nr:hypothetical protein MC57_001455 [Enterobacter hormaechei]